MYSTIDNIVKSLRSAWEYKILWVFALVIGSGGIIANYNFSPNLPDTQFGTQQQTSNTNHDAELDTIYDRLNESVLGVMDFGKPADVIYPVPTVGQFIPNFFAVFLAVTASVIFATFLWLIISSWAMGSLIAGSDVEVENGPLNLKGLSDIGTKKIKEIIKLRLLIFALWFMITAVFVLATIPLFTLLDGIVVYILSAVIVFILILISSAILAYSLLFGMRYVVLLNKNAKEAFILGIKAFKTNLDRSILLSLGNFFIHMGTTALTLTVIAIPFGLLTLFLVEPFYNTGRGFVFDFPTFSLPIMLLLIPFGLVVIAFHMAMTGFIKTYKYIAWTNLFRYIEKKPEEGSSNGI
jgi:hypothetical protein